MQRVNVQPIYSNYKRDNKFLGIIDYKSLYVCIAYAFIIFIICSILPLTIEYAVYLFMFLVVPVIAIFCVNINNESSIDVITTIFEYMLKKNIYVRVDYMCDFKKAIYCKSKN